MNNENQFEAPINGASSTRKGSLKVKDYQNILPSLELTAKAPENRPPQ